MITFLFKLNAYGRKFTIIQPITKTTIVSHILHFKLDQDAKYASKTDFIAQEMLHSRCIGSANLQRNLNGTWRLIHTNTECLECSYLDKE